MSRPARSRRRSVTNTSFSSWVAASDAAYAAEAAAAEENTERRPPSTSVERRPTTETGSARPAAAFTDASATSASAEVSSLPPSPHPVNTRSRGGVEEHTANAVDADAVAAPALLVPTAPAAFSATTATVGAAASAPPSATATVAVAASHTADEVAMLINTMQDEVDEMREAVEQYQRDNGALTRIRDQLQRQVALELQRPERLQAEADAAARQREKIDSLTRHAEQERARLREARRARPDYYVHKRAKLETQIRLREWETRVASVTKWPWTCTVCACKPSTYVSIPCGHLALCDTCTADEYRFKRRRVAPTPVPASLAPRGPFPSPTTAVAADHPPPPPPPLSPPVVQPVPPPPPSSSGGGVEAVGHEMSVAASWYERGRSATSAAEETAAGQAAMSDGSAAPATVAVAGAVPGAPTLVNVPLQDMGRASQLQQLVGLIRNALQGAGFQEAESRRAAEEAAEEAAVLEPVPSPAVAFTTGVGDDGSGVSPPWPPVSQRPAFAVGEASDDGAAGGACARSSSLLVRMYDAYWDAVLRAAPAAAETTSAAAAGEPSSVAPLPPPSFPARTEVRHPQPPPPPPPSAASHSAATESSPPAAGMRRRRYFVTSPRVVRQRQHDGGSLLPRSFFADAEMEEGEIREPPAGTDRSTRTAAAADDDDDNDDDDDDITISMGGETTSATQTESPSSRRRRRGSTLLPPPPPLRARVPGSATLRASPWEPATQESPRTRLTSSPMGTSPSAAVTTNRGSLGPGGGSGTAQASAGTASVLGTRIRVPFRVVRRNAPQREEQPGFAYPPPSGTRASGWDRWDDDIFAGPGAQSLGTPPEPAAVGGDDDDDDDDEDAADSSSEWEPSDWAMPHAARVDPTVAVAATAAAPAVPPATAATAAQPYLTHHALRRDRRCPACNARLSALQRVYIPCGDDLEPSSHVSPTPPLSCKSEPTT